MQSVTRSKSDRLRLLPLGRQSPRLNKDSDVPSTNFLYSLKIGCKWRGFHNGLDSIFSSSKANRIRSQISNEGVSIQLSHRLE